MIMHHRTGRALETHSCDGRISTNRSSKQWPWVSLRDDCKPREAPVSLSEQKGRDHAILLECMLPIRLHCMLPIKPNGQISHSGRSFLETEEGVCSSSQQLSSHSEFAGWAPLFVRAYGYDAIPPLISPLEFYGSWEQVKPSEETSLDRSCLPAFQPEQLSVGQSSQ